MADNSLQGGSDLIRDIDKTGVKTQVMAVDIGGAGAEQLLDAAHPMPVADEASGNFLWRILQLLLAPLGYDKSLSRYRGTVVVETLPTLAAVTNVATVTNQTNIGGFNADAAVRAQINTAWNLNVRSRIS